MSFIQNVMGVTSSSIASLCVYFAIVAVFIVGVFACIVPVLSTRGHLRNAVHIIKQGKKAKKSWQEDDFLGRGSLMAHWSAYLNNLFFADGVYHNASNVEDFINEETVIYGPGRASFCDAVPSLLTSIGFLGTLIGLAQGLSGFNMSDAAAVQSSIVTLIPGMRYAFVTSIFGVIGSVAFTLITRMVYGSTEHTLRSFYGAMSRYAGVLSVDPLTQMAIYQQEQTALIQSISKNLNGAFQDNVARTIEGALEPVRQDLRSFMTVTSKDQMRFLDAVVTRFIERMDVALSGRLRDFSDVLSETGRHQRDVLDAVSHSLKASDAAVQDLRSVQAITGDMVSTLNDYIARLRDSQRQSDDLYSRLTGSAEKLDLVSRQQAAYLKTVSQMQQELTASVQAMTGAVASAANAMQKSGGVLTDASARMESAQRSAAKSLDSEYKATMDAYRDYVNQFTQRVDYLSGSIADALAALPKAVSDTSEDMLDQFDRLSRTLEDAQTALNRTVDRMYEKR